MKRKILVVCAIITCIIANVVTVQAASATVDLKLGNVTNGTVKRGDTFTVTLSVNSPDGINGIFGKEENQRV